MQNVRVGKPLEEAGLSGARLELGVRPFPSWASCKGGRGHLPWGKGGLPKEKAKGFPSQMPLAPGH